MKKKVFCVLIVFILACLTILVACNKVEQPTDNDTNAQPSVAETILGGLAENLKITYTVRENDTQEENEITFYKVGKHFLIKKYDSDAKAFGYYLAAYNESENNWDGFAIFEGDEAWAGNDEFMDLSFEDVLHHDLFYSLFYEVLDPEYKYLENSQLTQESIQIGSETYVCDRYQYHSDKQGTVFFWIADIGGVKFCLQYSNTDITAKVASYETDFPLPDLDLPAPPIGGIEGGVGDGNGEAENGTNFDIIEKLPQKFKITFNAISIQKTPGSSESYTEVNERYIYKVGYDFLTKYYHPNYRGYIYNHYKYNATWRLWDGYILYPGEEWKVENTKLAANQIFYPNAIPFTFDIFSMFAYPDQNYKETSTLVGSEDITISGITYTCNKYTHNKKEQCTFWITNINEVEHCLKHTIVYSPDYSRGMEITAYETEGVEFPKVLPGDEIPPPPPETVLKSSSDIYASLPENFKITYNNFFYYNSDGEGEVEDIIIYKAGTDFLIKHSNVSRGLDYSYYQFNADTNEWTYRKFYSNGGRGSSGRRYSVEDLFESWGVQGLYNIFTEFTDPLYHYNTAYTELGAEDVKISNISYSCNKYKLGENVFWITMIDDIAYTLIRTRAHGSGTIDSSVTGFETSNIVFPVIEGITLPGQDPSGGTGEDPGGTGENPGGETPLTAEGIIDGLANALNVNFKLTYPGHGEGTWSIEIQGYKINKDFLFQTKDIQGDYNYYYYKYNDTENNWAEYFLHAYDDAWTHRKGNLDALALLTESSYDQIREVHKYMLLEFKDPSNYEFVKKGLAVISGTTYTYDEYQYTYQETTATFWLTTINGVKHCIYFTNGADTFEVTSYITTGVTFPDTHGVELP